MPTKAETREKYPIVSVIIPALNEEKNIARCLQSIVSLNYPKDKLDVIVVDNGSVDNTCQVAASFHATVVECEGNIGAVRNAGARIAKGQIYAFLDADCVAQENWLAAAVDALAEDMIGIVGGICLVDSLESNWVERAWVLNPIPQKKDVHHIATASFILRKEVFDQVGGFNETVTSGEDMELSSRVRNAGYKLRLLPECAVFHFGYPKKLLALLKRQIWHATSYLETMQDRTNPVFLVTHLFAVACISTPFFLLNASSCDLCLLLSLSLIFGIPLSATIYKFYKNGSRISMILLCQGVVIMMLYFIGRSIGLLRSYIRKILLSSSS